jgi:hypothetical protein
VCRSRENGIRGLSRGERNTHRQTVVVITTTRSSQEPMVGQLSQTDPATLP